MINVFRLNKQPKYNIAMLEDVFVKLEYDRKVYYRTHDTTIMSDVK